MRCPAVISRSVSVLFVAVATFGTAACHRHHVRIHVAEATPVTTVVRAEPAHEAVSPTPVKTFACGTARCVNATEACARTPDEISDVDDYACVPLPTASSPCAVLTKSECACSQSEEGAVRVTCPG